MYCDFPSAAIVQRVYFYISILFVFYTVASWLLPIFMFKGGSNRRVSGVVITIN